MTDDLQFALQLADVADAITLRGFTDRTFGVHSKEDSSDVTDIDRAAETALRELVISARPDHGFYGEEHGRVNPTANVQWVVDPIDGTSNFVRGVPVWATLIAVVTDDQPTIGVVSAPPLGRRWWAECGHGSYVNGSPISVSEVHELERAHVSVSHSKGWADLGLVQNLVQLQTTAHRSRGFGDFWQHMLVAEGAIDVAIDAVGLQPYDNAALYPIVTESGGRITDRHGKPSWKSDTQISTNGLLHDRIIRHLSSER
ncbi:MAG: inositol monophosphatase family protein [Ilumatobacteraceae bacterium]